FGGGGDEGNEGQVDEQRIVAAHFLAELTDRLEERQRLDVAHRAADFRDHDVVIGGEAADRRLDLVGDVGDHLHGRAEVFAAPLLGDHGQVDPPGGDVVDLRQRAVDEALVV